MGDQTPLELDGTVTVSGLSIGKRYALLRYSDPAQVPDQHFLESKFTEKIEFVASGMTYSHKVNFLSNSTAMFRCVESAARRLRGLAATEGSTTETEGFGGRMEKAFIGFLVGWILLIFSVPVLWLNERNASQMESIIGQGYSDCKTIDADRPEPENNATIVHVTAEAKALEEVKAENFEGASFKHGCLVLKMKSEMFQHIENKSQRSEENLGGSRTTTTTYTYSQSWSEAHQRIQNERHDAPTNPPAPWELGTSK